MDRSFANKLAAFFNAASDSFANALPLALAKPPVLDLKFPGTGVEAAVVGEVGAVLKPNASPTRDATLARAASDITGNGVPLALLNPPLDAIAGTFRI